MKSWVLQEPAADPLSTVQSWLDRFQAPRISDLPPFQGGVAGYLGYEFGRCLERIPAARHDEFSTPLAVLGLYDVVFAWDHELDQGWVISQGFSLHETQIDRREQATRRLDQFMSWIESDTDDIDSYRQPSVHAMAHGLTAEQFETRLGGGWLGNFDSQGYRAAVQKARDYIYAGDIFQVNLSQRLLCPARCKSDELYEHLRLVNAAPLQGTLILAADRSLAHLRNDFIMCETDGLKLARSKGPVAERETRNEIARRLPSYCRAKRIARKTS